MFIVEVSSSFQLTWLLDFCENDSLMYSIPKSEAALLLLNQLLIDDTEFSL